MHWRPKNDCEFSCRLQFDDFYQTFCSRKPTEKAKAAESSSKTPTKRYVEHVKSSVVFNWMFFQGRHLLRSLKMMTLPVLRRCRRSSVSNLPPNLPLPALWRKQNGAYFRGWNYGVHRMSLIYITGSVSWYLSLPMPRRARTKRWWIWRTFWTFCLPRMIVGKWTSQVWLFSFFTMHIRV